MIHLRPYQTDLIARTYQAYQSGNRNVLVQLPTGGGKSIIVSQVILDGHQQGMTECVIAHRNELVGQMSLHVARRGIPHRIIASKSAVSQITSEHRREFGRSLVNPDARCSVVSVDTLVARADTLKPWAQQVQRWTIDEAHHVLAANKWGRAVTMFPNAYGLGVTATPRRADGMGLGAHHDGVFHTMIHGPSMRELIDSGSLSDYEIVIPDSDFEIDDAQLAPSGDWSSKRMREASKRSHIVGDVVVEYQRHALGKRAICFATDVETAGEMAQRFNDAGIVAASVSAKTPTETRNEYIRRFRDGRITVLVNVDLFGEGFDVPAVEVVIMARPTASLAVYLQQFGRALRPMAGKSHGLVIDHVSNWKRHGFPDKNHIWTLDRREKRAKQQPDPDDIPLTACRSCSRPYERCLTVCPYCGEAPPVPEGGGRSIDQVDGDLMLLNRETLAQMRAAMELETPADAARRVGAAAGDLAGRGAANRQMERHAAQERLRGAIEQWAGIRRAAGEDDRQIQRRFYIATGVDVLSAMSGKRSEMDALTNTVRSWYGGEPLDTQKKTDEQLMIEAAIERGDQGFRGGWIEVGLASDILNTPVRSLAPILKEMGYYSYGQTKRLIGHEYKCVTLYHLSGDADTNHFWVSNEYVEDHKKTVQDAIERGEQGFREGWLTASHVSKITDLKHKSLELLISDLGYISFGRNAKKINGEHHQLTLYHRDSNASVDDFWLTNGYITELSEDIKSIISSGEKGFKNGWVETFGIREKININPNKLTDLLKELGYAKIGQKGKRVKGEYINRTLFHKDPNADPADFWASNGYE